MTKKKTLRDEAWRWCSIYVRVRDASAGSGFVKCCTCPLIAHWTEMQAGHFLCGRGYEVLFDDALIHSQCPKCNCDGGGEEYKYAEFLKNKYGWDDENIKELLPRKFMSKKVLPAELVEIKHRFREEARKIAKEKSLTIPKY